MVDEEKGTPPQNGAEEAPTGPSAVEEIRDAIDDLHEATAEAKAAASELRQAQGKAEPKADPDEALNVALREGRRKAEAQHEDSEQETIGRLAAGNGSDADKAWFHQRFRKGR